MSKVQTLRAFINQRLTLAAEEIFDLFEKTIEDYEEELWRQHRLLDAVLKPEVRLHRTDVQQLLVRGEEVPPEQQEWSPLVDQEEQPELPHIKEEQEELQRSQKKEQLQGLEEADITKITFTPVPVKSEEDEEKLQSSWLYQRQTDQMETEADGEDCGGPEPARKWHDKKSYPSEPETDDSCDWEETRELQAGSNPPQNNEEPLCDMKCNFAETSVITSECATNERRRQKHNEKEEGECFSCSVCKKAFLLRTDFLRHMEGHTGEKPYSCSFCGKRFTGKSKLSKHLRIHSGEKAFSCLVCKASFRYKRHLSKHMKGHTGEKPYSCSVCGKRLSRKSHLTDHLRVHTGEKPFSCSICKKGFSSRFYVLIHMRIHTGEKPFSCSVCGKRFTRKDTLKKHIRLHTGEKPFSCSVRGKRFSYGSGLTNH